MPLFDRTTAMDRLNQYEDEKRAHDELTERVNAPRPFGVAPGRSSADEELAALRAGLADRAAGLAESLDGALAMIDRLHPLIHVGDRLDRLPGWQYRAERESERLHETSGADPEDGYDIGYARAVSDFARFLLDGLAEDRLAKLLDL